MQFLDILPPNEDTVLLLSLNIGSPIHNKNAKIWIANARFPS